MLYRRLSIAAPLLIIAAAAARADDANQDSADRSEPAATKTTSLHPGAIEVGLSAGRSLGDIGGVLVTEQAFSYRISARGSFGGTVYAAAAITKPILAVAEASFLNGSRAVNGLGPGETAQTYTRAVVYDAALEYRFSAKRLGSESRRPLYFYAGLGAGTVQSKSDVTVQFAALTPSQSAGGILASATQVRYRAAAFAPLFLAGLEKFTGHRFGFRLEGRGMQSTGSSHVPIGLVTVGIFYIAH